MLSEPACPCYRNNFVVVFCAPLYSPWFCSESEWGLGGGGSWLKLVRRMNGEWWHIVDPHFNRDGVGGFPSAQKKTRDLMFPCDAGSLELTQSEDFPPLQERIILISFPGILEWHRPNLYI
jgi:hypothetical protein